MPTRWVTVLLVGWIGALAIGLTLAATWETTPGTASAAPAYWPLAASLPRSAAQPTVVLFANPQCGCTRATLAELAAVMRDSRHDASALVVFVVPEDEQWQDTATWEVAGTVPRAHRFVDRGGVLAKQFGAATSGQVVVYDRSGALVFAGGITGSRGHVGDNVGRRSLLARLLARPGESGHDVFGCALGAS